MQVKLQFLCFLAGIILLSLTACSSDQNQASTLPRTKIGHNTDLEPRTNVLVDGSGTVSVITQVMKEKFTKANLNVRLAIGSSGTGDGFTRLCDGVIDIAMAARPIKKSEIETCQKNKIEFVELPLALDGVSIIVNRTNTWATCLKPEELAKIWEPAAEGKILNWKQVRNNYPARPIFLAGYAQGSGTRDYFAKAIGTKDGEIRSDYQAGEEPSVTIQRIASDPGSLGFTTFSYYIRNEKILKSLAIENKEGKCVQPSLEAISSGSYNPFSLPLFIYVNKTDLKQNPVLKAFAQYHIEAANRSLISEAGYVPLPDDLLEKVQARLDNAIAGSIYEGESPVGVKLADKLATSQKR